MSDIGITKDGDLILGMPVTDKDGNVVYENGKELLDFSLKQDFEETKQMIYSRLKTEKWDWYIYPLIGTALSDLVGQPNTKETAEVGIDNIIKALTYDGLFNALQVEVKAVPVNIDEIVFMVKIQISINNAYKTYAILNVNQGVEINANYAD